MRCRRVAFTLTLLSIFLFDQVCCLLYTSDAADDRISVDLGGRRIIKKIFFKQKTAYEIRLSLVGSEMCIRDRSIAFNTIIYISGLQTIPEDVYEASAIDGASGWNNFWKITFPLIAPFFTINMVLCMRNFLMVFDQIMSLTSGGPAESTTSISMLIYKNGLTGNQFGLQSANSVIYFILIVAISAFQLKVLNKREVQL